MPELTGEGRRRVAEVAGRHGVSVETAETLLGALAASGGGQVQFNIPELGGMGQWSRGGMVMVGDMFNTALKAKVDALCGALAALAGEGGVAAPALAQSQSQSQSQGAGNAGVFASGSGGGNWWPEGLGAPASVGAQNDMRYAFFPESRRLVIDRGGEVTVYDTGEHRLGGFSQQQSGDRSLSFTSQHGPVKLADLRVVRDGRTAVEPEARPAPAGPEARSAGAATVEPASASAPVSAAAPASGSRASDDIFDKVERLADLHARGIISAEEFEAKKSELLGRL